MHLFIDFGAQKRLELLHPGLGQDKYVQANRFVEIASYTPEVPLLVPPEIDQDLHEILSVRGENGRGLEMVCLEHLVQPIEEIGITVGKTFAELTHPLAVSTRETLVRHGFKHNDKAEYTQPACTLTVLMI